MDLERNTATYSAVASEILRRLEIIAHSALEKLNSPPDPRTAVANTFTSEAALRTLSTAFSKNKTIYESLAAEPAIARVVVSLPSGDLETFYFCRSDHGLPPDVFGYLAPNGRLASLPIGTDFTLRNGVTVSVVGRAQLHPVRSADAWDSNGTVLEADTLGPITIESLRKYLADLERETDAENLLAAFIAKEEAQNAVFHGIKRSVITKMALRDQPVLDQFQDEIFRLPLGSQLILLGPPGTGKTTTLIRRLAQKRNITFLNADERTLLEESGANAGEHADSWLMVTPTELLSQYLKEAFAREDVPAPNHRLATWFDLRRELGRNIFNVLRSSGGSGSLVLNEESKHLAPTASEHAIEWFEAFFAWHNHRFIEELRADGKVLCDATSPDVRSIGLNLKAVNDCSDAGAIDLYIRNVALEAGRVRDEIDRIDATSRSILDRAMNLQLNRNRDFLSDLASFLDTTAPQPQMGDEELDEVELEEDTTPALQARRQSPVLAYSQAVRARARASVSGRPITKRSKNDITLEWLGDRVPTEGELKSLGAGLMLRTHLSRLAAPIKHYFAGCAKRYRAYRKEYAGVVPWLLSNAGDSAAVHPLELDVLLLTLLQTSSSLLGHAGVRANIDRAEWSALKRVFDLQRNQMLVDEATDFSPIQLACMAAMSRSGLRSFFACGDFNQRLTTWGTRSVEELEWAIPGITSRNINTSYRQSAQLNIFAHEIGSIRGGAATLPALPERVGSDGVCPALLENEHSAEKIASWLADRIREIEQFVGQLPSVAVFVNCEADVDQMAIALSAALADDNIAVTACRDGQVVGHDSNVRVFDIQHIKGLEFEAVFFTGVDDLAMIQPSLFDKYLYVGATRAATYLGITCYDQLPAELERLRPRFCADWASL